MANNINELVAEHVMGWERMRTGVGKHQNAWKRGHAWCNTPKFDENIADAWLVVEKMREKGWLVSINEDDVPWIVCFYKFDGEVYGNTHAETVEEAICLAALDALGVEVQDELEL